ncbi:hypothetical protein NS277_16440 [Novosphingobium barchaimii]|nr:hypothetical protein NS277_16440 [Novosphingobium barchaimii]
MIRLTFLAVAFIATPASGQVVSAPPVASIPANVATKGDVAAVQAQIPQPSDSVPVAYMATSGQVGTSPRYRRPDDQAPRISRTVSGTTTTGGSGAVTWPAMPSIPKLTVTPYVTSNAVQAPICLPVTGTVTTTGATIKCWSTQTITVSVLGPVVAPITAAAAGVQFDVLALPGS